MLLLLSEFKLILKKNNIPFQKTLSFFDNDSHAKCLKHSNKLVVSIENNFKYNVGGTRLNAISDWLSNWVRLSASNYIIFLIEVITTALNKHKPDRIYIAHFPPNQYKGWAIKPNQYFHSDVCKLIASKINIDVNEFEVQEIFSFSMNLKS